jgi:hypothetical protein
MDVWDDVMTNRLCLLDNLTLVKETNMVSEMLCRIKKCNLLIFEVLQRRN